MATKINHMGQQFGNWTVIDEKPSTRYFSGGRYSYVANWLCRCACGKERVVKGDSLRRGVSKGCGACNRYLRPYETLYRHMRKNAIERGRVFELSYDDFVSFTTTRNCHYCGNIVTWAEHTPEKIANGFRSNLDRKDNSVGYIVGNLVVCCWECNNAKSSRLSYDEMCVVGLMRRKMSNASPS